MSDCFDHEIDAYESLEHEHDDDDVVDYQDEYIAPRKTKTKKEVTYEEIRYTKLLKRTDKAIQVQFTEKYLELRMWIPFSSIEDMDEDDEEDKVVYVSSSFLYHKKRQIKEMLSER